MQSDYSVDVIDTVVDEEITTNWGYKHPLEPIEVCKCILDEPSEEVVISPRKKLILSTVSRTQEYLCKRRIPEFIRFLLTKVIASGSPQPVVFIKELLDDCMLFRAGHGHAPVLYEKRHMQAIVKSFDPGNRGWLSSGQICRAFATVGLTAKKNLPDKMSVNEVLAYLEETQAKELKKLLSAGIETDIVEESSDKESQSNINSDSKVSSLQAD